MVPTGSHLRPPATEEAGHSGRATLAQLGPGDRPRALCSAANTSSPALPAHLQRALFPGGVPAALGMFGIWVASHDWLIRTLPTMQRGILLDPTTSGCATNYIAAALFYSAHCFQKPAGSPIHPRDALIPNGLKLPPVWLSPADLCRWEVATSESECIC